MQELRRRKLSRIFLFFFFIQTILLFQNCGNSFQSIQSLDSSQESGAGVQPEGERDSNNTEVPPVLAPPEISFSSSMDSVVTSENYTVNFSIENASNIKSISCTLNGIPVVACTPSSVSMGDLQDGDYTLKIEIESKSGVKVEKLWVFRKDAQPPTLNFSSRPSTVTGAASAEFVFNVTDNLAGVEKIECAFDTDQYTECVSPIQKTGLASGTHTFRVRAQDFAGNKTSEDIYTWVVDLSQPSVSLSQTPMALTQLNSAAFSFVGNSVNRFECQLDDDEYSACTSPHQKAGLQEGVHRFAVRGFSAAGLPSAPAVFEWKVDSTKPSTPEIRANVLNPTNQTTAVFNFSSTDSISGIDHFECARDGVRFITCLSPYTWINSNAGNYTLSIRAVDQVGLVSDVKEFSWKLDLAAPLVNLTSALPYNSESEVQITFSVHDVDSSVATVTCLETPGDTTPKPCSNGVFTSADLTQGVHTLSILATDTAGNSTSFRHSWNLLPAYVGLQANQISAGQNYTCVVNSFGSLNCFGKNDVGQLGIGTASMYPVFRSTVTSGGVSMVKASGTQTCAIMFGDVFCWGNPKVASVGQATVGAILYPEYRVGGGATDLAVSNRFGCALFRSSVQCWGENSDGQLGNGTIIASDFPTQPVMSGASDVAVGDNFACAIVNGGLECWGHRSVFNDMAGMNRLFPERIVTSGVKKISASGTDVCYATADNVKCFGLKSGVSPAQAKTVFAKPVLDLSISHGADCVVDISKTLHCRGRNDFGQLGIGSYDDIENFVPVLGDVTQVSTSVSHTCVIQRGQQRCWGSNLWSELQEENNFNYQFSPRIIKNSVSSVSIQKRDWYYRSAESASTHLAADFGLTCVDSNIDKKCWGVIPKGVTPTSDNGIQIQSGSQNYHRGLFTLPRNTQINRELDQACSLSSSGMLKCNDVASLTLPGVSSFDLGSKFGCAVTANGVRCWGANSDGQLGNNSKADSNDRFVNVLGLPAGVTQVALGLKHACALAGDAVYCWGRNDLSNIGPSQTKQILRPNLRVVSGVSKIKAGGTLTCMLMVDGSVRCFGYSAQTDKINENTVQFDSGVTDFAVTEENMCAIVGGALKCKGLNMEGQVGNRNSLKVTNATTVIPTGVVSIAMGGGHTCAVVRSTLFCWGNTETTNFDLTLPIWKVTP